MHYAFVPMGEKAPKSQSDPIELVSDLCAIDNIEVRWLAGGTHTHTHTVRFIVTLLPHDSVTTVQVDVADIHGRTPVMYGAMMCAQVGDTLNTQTRTQPCEHTCVCRSVACISLSAVPVWTRSTNWAIVQCRLAH